MNPGSIPPPPQDQTRDGDLSVGGTPHAPLSQHRGSDGELSKAQTRDGDLSVGGTPDAALAEIRILDVDLPQDRTPEADTSGPPQRRDLSVQERLVAQRAIEEVFSRHRLGSAPGGEPDPARREAISEIAVRAKVEDYLRKSNALGALWGRPLAATQLEAEVERMARDSRQPAVLSELFAALGNDPFLIAECLARPILADRMIRSWYARDERFHGGLRRRVEASLAARGTSEGMEQLSGSYVEVTWRLGKEIQEKDPLARTIDLSPAEWNAALSKLATRFGSRAGTLEPSALPPEGGSASAGVAAYVRPTRLPLQQLSDVEETNDAFTVSAVLAQHSASVTLATVIWSKTPFEAWWAHEGASVSLELTPPAMTYPGVSLVVTSCTDDTWAPTDSDVPDPRSGQTAVWTGSEMIVWGGFDGLARNTGGRYSPATDTWVPTSTGPGVPGPRYLHTAIWTGSQMLVWGGWNGLAEFNSGGRYDPVADTWLATSTGANVPAGRHFHTAVWTGSEMLVWGGSPLTNSGRRYDPVTNSWTVMSTGPASRYLHTAVWSGTEMIVWGGTGASGADLGTGSRYDPVSDAWTATGVGAGAPSPRTRQTAVWTGSEMMVWGGFSGSSTYHSTGARYSPSTDTWAATGTGPGLPAPRAYHAAVWTGQDVIVWGGYNGGYLNSGGRYDPAQDTWASTGTGAGVPSGRIDHSAVWTGLEMIVWGGNTRNTGGRYDPLTDQWVPTGLSVIVPAMRQDHTAVWTGSEMIVWGGFDGISVLGTGGRYLPATDTWIPTPVGAGAPVARRSQTAVWSGREMIVWGGSGVTGASLNSGGRYDPAQDAWSPTAIGGAVPDARAAHTAVWTGKELIVWGGIAGGIRLNTGGRYNPATDVWSATSTGVSVPVARTAHTAIWAGRSMIVWGGTTGAIPLNTGGSYDPSSDTWTPTPTGTGVPAARSLHSAVWTGTEMLIWGGMDSASRLFTGGRYNPASALWLTTSTEPGVPAARRSHSAAWTGSEMIIWGGDVSSPGSITGARYAVSSNTWRATSLGSGVPPARSLQTAVWTGSEMIVWGGAPPTATGARYCAVSACLVRPWFRDADGDGYGLSFNSVLACSQPPGYVGAQGDCDDANASLNPGRSDANCNGLDDDCSGQADEDFVGPATQCGVGACSSTGAIVCSNSAMVNSCMPGVPAPGDSTCNGIDDDCSGQADEDFQPTVTACGVGACARSGMSSCVGGAVQSDCVPGPPGSIDANCNGIDENCNGQADEGFVGPATNCGVGACERSGAIVCAGGSLVDTCVPGPPAPSDDTCNGIDDDCDGQPDQGYPPEVTACGVGSCARNGLSSCGGGVVLANCAPGAPEPEVCDGHDNNCDGAVDNAMPPAATPQLSVELPEPGLARLSWNDVPTASSYDVVRGYLLALSQTQGDFSIATEVCFFERLQGTVIDDDIIPRPGKGFWYLVRAANCGGAASYDDPTPSQVGSRDPGIQSSRVDCYAGAESAHRTGESLLRLPPRRG